MILTLKKYVLTNNCCVMLFVAWPQESALPTCGVSG